MKGLTRLLFLILLLTPLFLFLAGNKTLANSPKLPTITVINMIRGNALGREQADLLPRLKAQWQDTKEHDVKATWLWQYDALRNTALTSYAKSDLKNQEFGLFLEVDRNLAQKAGVLYRGRGPWYFSDGLFTFSYDLSERKKLLDTIFSQFHDTFGYYPTTVGAWWVDADALSYMQQKYGITASLRAADQYNLDVYSIWGTPWSIPYLASIDNAGIPAETIDTSSHIVIMQWAARDPLRGYDSSSSASTYSLEDYELKHYDSSYFDYLAGVYLKSPLDQIVIGLENDNDETTFTPGGHYNNLLNAATTLRKKGKATITRADDYAQAFLSRQQVFSPTHYFLSKDYEKDDQSFWYNSPSYRISIQKKGDTISLVDYHDYSTKVREAFSLVPNSQGTLRIYTPAVIDSATFTSQKKLLMQSKKSLRTTAENGTIKLWSGEEEVGFFNDQTFHVANLSLPLPQANASNFYPLSFVIAGAILVYLLLASLKAKPSQRFALESSSLFIPLLIAYPFLNSLPLKDSSYFLDKKEIMFSFLFSLIPLPPELKMIFLFQILPFVVLLGAHFLLMVRKTKSKTTKYIYYAIIGAVTVLYLHVPYFPLDRSTYREVAMSMGLLAFTLIILAVMIYLKTKTKKTILIALIAIPTLLVIMGGVLYLSRSRLVITPFEMNALKLIAAKHKDVIYLYPTDKPIYKAIKPVLLDNYHVGERLTDTDWQALVRVKGRLVLSDYKGKLIMVPRYLGSDISPEEIKKFGLTKIFDNSQIAIFE